MQKRPSISDLIPISEYAKIHGIDPATVRQKCIRGGFETAIKIGNYWVINRNEPHTDHRKKN